MKLQDKIIIVTGGARGIGRAMCERFAAEGPRAVVVADLELRDAEEVAAALAARTTALAIKTDVGVEAEIRDLVAIAQEKYGRIDLFCSNAGIGGPPGGEEVPNEDWQKIWEVNLMSHVYAARAVLPGMLARGEGYLLNTASAAGLLTQIGAAPYSVTKHAAVSLAEWLSITYGDRGVKVSCLCPQGVRTDMLREAAEKGAGAFLLDTAIAPETVAEAVVRGLDEEKFLILPHPDVATFFQHKAGDYDRWLRGMRRLKEQSGKSQASKPFSKSPPDR